MSESTYHQIHFAWAEPTLLGRVGPGPAASSLAESGRPSLRSWRDRLVPALTVDYRSALPGTDPADLPETLWARSYADGQAALVYRWPGDVRDAHAWAVVGPAHGLTLPRILSLHENPNTRPAARRPPAPGWASMPALEMPTPWELTAAPGAVRTRDRRAAETTVQGETVLVGALASALHAPDRPIRIALEPEHADLWQATQIRVLWGMHRILHDVLTPARAIPAAGWQWSFSTYDPDLATEGQHLAFGPPRPGADGPYLHAPDPEYRRVAERLVEVLRDEGGDALADHLRDRGVPDAPTFGDRRALLAEWLDPGTAVGVSGGAAAPPDGAARPGPAEEVASQTLADQAGAGVTSAGGAAPVGERGTDTADAGTGALSEPGARSTGADASGEQETHSRPGDAGGVAQVGTGDADNVAEAGGVVEAVGSDARDVPGSGPAVGPSPRSGGGTGDRGEPVWESGPDGSGHDARHDGDASLAESSPRGSGALGRRWPGADGTDGVDETDGADIPEAEPLPSDGAAPGGPTVSAATGAASHVPEHGRGRPGSENALDDQGQDEHNRTEPDTFRPRGAEDRHSAGPPPEANGASGPESPPREGEGIPRPGAGSSLAHEEPGSRTAAGPGPRPAGDDLPSAPARQAGHEAVDAVAGEGEGTVGSAEPGASDRPRPHAYSRSVAGAHPSFRLNRPSDEDDGDPLPEVEDLDAPASAHESRASVDPDRGARARAATGDGAGEPGESTADARSEGRAPQHPPGTSRPLFGERRPGFAPSSEHPVFGAPEPHDPPARPTGEPPPLDLPRTPENDLHPRTPDDHVPAPDPTDPIDPSDPTESSEPSAPEPRRSDAGRIGVRGGPRRHAEEAFGGPARDEPSDADDLEDTDGDAALHERSPSQAPPLIVAHDGVPAPDYAAETEPETDPDFDDSGANWPTQYADLPLARLERWHAKRGPEGAHTDVVDARAAVRAERSELQRVREERDHYHAEVQDLRREVARLDRPFLDGDAPAGANGGRRWPARLLVAVLLVAFLATGLEAGARFGVGALDVLSALPFVP